MKRQKNKILICKICGHSYEQHFGWYFKNPCHVKNCKCLDYAPMVKEIL
jgi:hypothetical protein